MGNLPQLFERKKPEFKSLSTPAYLPSIDIEKVPQKNSVFVLGIISLVTLWIYPAFWYMRRSREFVNLGTEKKLGKNLAAFYLAMQVLFILSIIILPFTISENPGSFSQNVTTAQIITLMLVIIFFVISTLSSIALGIKSRGIINEALKNKGEKNISLLFTIIFGSLYIQYEINRIIEDKEKQTPVAPWILLLLILAAIGFGILFFG
ncbi:DUF4234 domain-containing protein [Candidatus Pacearchaeota archaeon]|nr:DUF4234 domain-containing protein [Candidatus Pacearchaeota archaeon]